MRDLLEEFARIDPDAEVYVKMDQSKELCQVEASRGPLPAHSPFHEPYRPAGVLLVASPARWTLGKP